MPSAGCSRSARSRPSSAERALSSPLRSVNRTFNARELVESTATDQLLGQGGGVPHPGTNERYRQAHAIDPGRSRSEARCSAETATGASDRTKRSTGVSMAFVTSRGCLAIASIACSTWRSVRPACAGMNRQAARRSSKAGGQEDDPGSEPNDRTGRDQRIDSTSTDLVGPRPARRSC